MLVGRVVDDEFDEHLHVALVGGAKEALEVVDGAVAGIDPGVVGDVVAVVSKRRRKEGKEPEAGDAEVLEVVEARDEAGEVADAVAVGVLEGADVELVDDGVFVPEGISCTAGFLHWVALLSVCVDGDGAEVNLRLIGIWAWLKGQSNNRFGPKLESSILCTFFASNVGRTLSSFREMHGGWGAVAGTLEEAKVRQKWSTRRREAKAGCMARELRTIA